MERYLGSLVGVCRISVGDHDHGEVTYSIAVHLKNREQSGKGVLSGNVVGIAAALARGVAKLTLPGGDTVDIRVHEANLRRGLFTVDGIVPGF